jgi:hypothetical protein
MILGIKTQEYITRNLVPQWDRVGSLAGRVVSKKTPKVIDPRVALTIVGGCVTVAVVEAVAAGLEVAKFEAVKIAQPAGGRAVT